MCSQERAISDTIAALGDGAGHERNKHARNAKPLHPIHYFSIELSMPFSPLGLAASRTSGPLTEDSERVTRDSERAGLLACRGLLPRNAMTQSEVPRRMSLGRRAEDPVRGTFDWGV